MHKILRKNRFIKCQGDNLKKPKKKKKRKKKKATFPPLIMEIWGLRSTP